jgi:amino acid transporter
MNEWLLISTTILSIVLLIILLIFVVMWKKKKEKTYNEPNYRIFLIIGIALFPIGLIFMGISVMMEYSFIITVPIFTIDFVYVALGLTHRNA